MADGKRRYSASQLSSCGLGSAAYLRRKLNSASIKFTTRKIAGNETRFYRYADLPAKWQKKIDQAEAKAKLAEHSMDPALLVDQATVEETAVAYADNPTYNRRKFDKYAAMLHELEPYSGQELKNKIIKWNQAHPSRKTSYPSIMRARKAAKEKGGAALIGSWGKRKGQSIVDPAHLERFKEEYAVEGGGSASSCWRTVVGAVCKDGDISSFPTAETFLRALRNQMGESALYLARHGFNQWNRKYASYVERDYSDLSAGQCWVSDHAQIDVMVKDPATGGAVCGWLTSFMDMKTGKVLGAFYHIEAPNSDHIFQAFYETAKRYGLPEYVYIDQGKDYRSKDFAGGRHKVIVDEKRATTMLSALGVKVIFSLPYNAQAKTIERMHLKIKEGFSKHLPGYRGGNVVERPQKLAAEIKAGNILDFAEFKAFFYDYMENVLNKLPSKGKILQGRSADDQWNIENPPKRTVSKDALRLFCMRTSRPLTIRRNGVIDAELNVTYWAEWMISAKGRKVYLRRPVEDFNECWVFAAETDTYLGNATIRGLVPAIATDEIGRQQLKEAMAAKRRELKSLKSLGVVKYTADVAEFLNNQKDAAALLNRSQIEEPAYTVSRIDRTEMDDITRRRKATERTSDNPATARIAVELAHAKRKLSEAQERLIQFPSERKDKESDIAYWGQETARLQAEWNGSKVKPLRQNEKSEPEEEQSLRARSGN